MNIEKNLFEVRRKIRMAAERSGRKADSVKIVAVSKTVTEDRILEAYRLGQRVFGENRVQEWQKKYPGLPDDCEWHFIGRLQTNKVKYLNRRIALIHSLDRLALLEKLNAEGEKRRITWPALVQVNVARDEAKAGLKVEEVKDFLTAAVDYPYVTISGLMTIGALDASPEETRGFFRELRELRDKLRRSKLPGADKICELSMGMSQDFEMAVEEGATIVRIGSNIFGLRS